jgi:type IV secretion system protein TrbF
MSVAPQISNPYLAPRQELNARNEWHIRNARNWRFATLWIFIALTGSLTLNIVQASKSRVESFVWILDRNGGPIAMGRADQKPTNDRLLVGSTIMRWVENFRTVTTDDIEQKKKIDDVYAYVAGGSPAQSAVSDWYRQHQPFERASNEVVSVSVQAVLPTGDRTYSADWTEVTYDRFGSTKHTEHWKGSFTTAQQAPSDAAEVARNPLGLYVTQSSWTKVE